MVSLAERGQLRIPKFQRSFVWDDSDVVALFDSVWRGFPIGTLLFWAREATASPVQFGPLEVEAPDSSEALWVVDGQQRLTTLVATLSTQVAHALDPRFDVCFDLRRLKFVHATKRPRPAWWLPLRVTLESRSLLGWIREFGTELSPDELDRADELAGTIRDYKIPAYVVENDDEELLRDVFDRVNSAGKPISRAQVFHALFGGDPEVGSALSVVESLTRKGFGRLDDQRVVQSLLAIRGGDIQRDIHGEFESSEDRADWFDQTERALGRAIDFLKRQGVPHLLLMPQTLPLPVLASFFHSHPNPDPWNEQLLARWMWRGWVHGFGRSGQTPALRQAVRAVNPVKRSPHESPDEHAAVASLLCMVPNEEPMDVVDTKFRTDRARGRLVLLGLVRLTPLEPGGSPFSVSAALDEFGADAITELVPGHRAMVGARGFWPVGTDRPHGSEDPEVLQSHAIDDAAASALRDGRDDDFVSIRMGQVRKLTADFLRSKVERDALARPPVAQLFVPED